MCIQRGKCKGIFQFQSTRRINEIASRMSLKSTEVENCSQIIRAILISSFGSSSCSQTSFPSIIRPILYLWMMISKMKFYLAEFNRSIFLNWTRIGKSQPVYLQNKYGVEIRIEPVNKDNAHSWVRISHGLNKLVTDLIDREYDDDEQETSDTKTEVFALKTAVFACANRSKAKAKPRRPSIACSSSRTVPVLERIWIDIEPRAQFDQAYPVAKRLNTLLRHGELPREEDGAIVFWRLKDDLQNNFEQSQYWSDDVWKSKMAGSGGNKKKIQYCTDPSGQEILYLRALQGHSGRNPIDPSFKDNVLIPNIFFEYT